MLKMLTKTYPLAQGWKQGETVDHQHDQEQSAT